MACSMSIKLACVVMVCLVVGAHLAQGAITCGQVASSLAPCITYLRGTGAGGDVPPGCCTGIKSLNAAAQTTPDRQSACKCIKTSSSNISGINYNLASGLPGKCGVSIPYKISPSTDCKSVR
ncbi:lipid transfer protein 3 [Hibiscus trionum]|uniref:Non-specific lipid-transfer protein n=1 Tax=Hibiscus trionum TaxID=183268 RepID=A0A9W7J4Q5_HIBTR|nr:lipid transfer protein 3 [Hibiscus trionum]